MSARSTILTALACVLTLAGLALGQPDPYGSIADLTLTKLEDAKDVPGVPPPEGAIVLFDGKSLGNWLNRNGKDPTGWKVIEGGVMQVVPGKGDIITKDKFDGRFKLHVEFRVPYEPKSTGQGRGNSGVYLQGRYEVQVLDSYGIPADKLGEGDCGGIYGVAKPPANVCKAPTVWQSYDIEFQSPTCEGGKPAAPAVMTVYHNGVKIHDNVRLVRKNKEGKEEIVTVTTAGLATDPCTPGPILLQDHGHPVQFRNIWLVPIKG
jgi:hypothetical protein